jgi:hypothetical protein
VLSDDTLAPSYGFFGHQKHRHAATRCRITGKKRNSTGLFLKSTRASAMPMPSQRHAHAQLSQHEVPLPELLCRDARGQLPVGQMEQQTSVHLFQPCLVPCPLSVPMLSSAAS